jgi:hypothetical protein
METNPSDQVIEWAREATASMFARCIETAARERQRQARKLMLFALKQRTRK